MTSWAFIKMHGCGNDYLFLDGFSQPLPDDISAFARSVSDRHRSVGSDGVVLMLPPVHPEAVGRMRMFNADGSEGSLCGNALRCFAMWLHQSGRAGTQFLIEMDDRLIGTSILRSDVQQRRANVRIDVGSPKPVSVGTVSVAACYSPVHLEGIHVPGLRIAALHVSMGNPHTVFFVRDLGEVPFHELGPQIEKHPAFPDRTNVEFVQVLGLQEARVRVWERGSGETLACGSGACAVVVAGVAAELLNQHQPTTVHMAGGDLQVFMDQNLRVFLEGPAEECCRGTVQWPASSGVQD